MAQHQVKGFRAGLLAKIRKQGDVTAENGLQTGADGPENRARAHDDSAYHA